MTDFVMEAKHVYKAYGKSNKKADTCIDIKQQVEAVKDVSLQIRKGDIKLSLDQAAQEKAPFYVVWLCLTSQRRVIYTSVTSA